MNIKCNGKKYFYIGHHLHNKLLLWSKKKEIYIQINVEIGSCCLFIFIKKIIGNDFMPTFSPLFDVSKAISYRTSDNFMSQLLFYGKRNRIIFRDQLKEMFINDGQ